MYYKYNEISVIKAIDNKIKIRYNKWKWIESENIQNILQSFELPGAQQTYSYLALIWLLT